MKEPKEYEIPCLSVVSKLFLTRKYNIKRRRCCLHRISKEGSFPWPAVVAAYDRKRLAAAQRTRNNLWQQRKLMGCRKNYPFTQDWCMSFTFYHSLCKRQFRIKAAFLLWQSLRLKDKRFSVLQYIRHHLFFSFASSTWHFPDTLLFTTSLYQVLKSIDNL